MAQQATQTKPINLIEAEEKTQAARTACALAKSKREMRNGLEDLEFWSNKLAMLSTMFERGMIGSAA